MATIVIEATDVDSFRGQVAQLLTDPDAVPYPFTAQISRDCFESIKESLVLQVDNLWRDRCYGIFVEVCD